MSSLKITKVDKIIDDSKKDIYKCKINIEKIKLTKGNKNLNRTNFGFLNVKITFGKLN